MSGLHSQRQLMDDQTCFRIPRLMLPRPETDLAKWAVIACDQYTSEPEYWHRVEREVGTAPSPLHLIVLEVYPGSADAPARIRRIQDTMRSYLADGLFHEPRRRRLRRVNDRRARCRGLMLELDLEHYDFSRDSTSLIRLTEGTMVERLASRIEVRRGAELEVPHVLMLIDDPACTVIEPIGAERDRVTKLYDTDLTLGGGHVAGYAVDGARGECAEHAARDRLIDKRPQPALAASSCGFIGP